MDLIILGSGTAIPLGDRGSPGLVMLIEKAPVLFDMGPGTLRQLMRVGVDYEKIERIFLTHFHPDHTADLIHFLFASRNPGVLKRRRPFVVAGPVGVTDLVSALDKAYHGWLSLPPRIMEIEEVRPGGIRDYGSFIVTAAPTQHSMNSLAYRVEDSFGRTVVYSGDTGFCEEVVDLARGAHLLILECSFPDGAEVQGHLTPSLAGRIATLAGVKRLVLTHFYPQCLQSDIVSQCRKSYGGELILGRDLLRIGV
ncbi:MAG: MBL fold metallo-hydrolase [Deltaproteobacteria bacterium]|nr:MBL fold metallo-hydrolase [Deltaproteobacteria bacterium]MBW2049335.1 MBL fold metallo-hydrolase [Deltaproteobacteria bacterium]MBW2353536.1 MBL fold metallo-hydrolase [Deltaproteobacteria bacterium]